jgi:DNA-binding NarL/FixJ family response regulator
MSVRVLIADNHPIFRGGLKLVVQDMADHLVIGEASDGDASLAQAELLRPDIVTLDLNMPGRSAFEVISWVRDNLPDCLVVVVSMHADRAFVEKAMECGAHGFVAKEDAGSELALAFRGGRESFYMSSAAGRREPLLALDAPGGDAVAAKLSTLTNMEWRVLRHVATLRTSREVARALGIAERTVHTHRNNICMKLGLRGANALLHFAVNHREEIDAGSPE